MHYETITPTDFRRRIRLKPVLFLMHPNASVDRPSTIPSILVYGTIKYFTTRLTAAAGARASNGIIIYNEPKKVLILLLCFFLLLRLSKRKLIRPELVSTTRCGASCTPIVQVTLFYVTHKTRVSIIGVILCFHM
jgi:hypothetical protein